MIVGAPLIVGAIMVDKVFVYGTLQPGQSNHNWVQEYVNAMHPAKVHGFRMYGKEKSFPCVLETDSEDDVVYGWLIILKNVETALEKLDLLEGHPILFERITTDVEAQENLFSAFIYVGKYPYPGEWISTGVWRP